MAVGVFYRPPGSTAETISALNNILSSLPDEQILIAGDFNLPELKWAGDHDIVPFGVVYSEFEDILNTYDFQQFVCEPTRGENILDLILCSSDIVYDVSIFPGISDHSIVTTSLTLPHLFRARESSRKVFIYEKENYKGIEKGLLEYLDDVTRLSLRSCVDTSWVAFKKCLSGLIEIYIPAKYIWEKTKADKTWMTYAVKREINQRRRADQKYKMHLSEFALSKLEKLNNAYKGFITLAKREYFDVLSDGIRSNSK